MRLLITIVAFAGIVLFQLVPLPRGILSRLSPRTSSLYERTIPGYAQGTTPAFDDWLLATDAARARIGASGPGGDARAPISYAPPGTRDKLLLLTAYVVLFLMVADRYRDSSRRRRLIVWITFTGVGIAILGVFQKLAWSGKILWLRHPPATSRPFGPFVNPNHFAGYMELIVPLALGLLLSLTIASRGLPSVAGARRGGRSPAPRPRDWGDLRRDDQDSRRLPWTASNRAPKAVLLGFLLALSVVSIVLSLSRGGFLATLLTFVLFARVLVPGSLRGRMGTKTLAGPIALVVVVLGIAFWLGSSAIAERAATLTGVQSDPSFLTRADTWIRTIDMFREHAAMGVGLGAFEAGFAGYYPPGTYGVWREAHNDYVQLLAEVGLMGMIPALLALFFFLRYDLFTAITDRGRADRYMGIGLAMGVVSLLLHSLVDFNLQIPAVAFLFVLVAGLLTASRREAGAEEGTVRRKGWVRFACLSGVVLLGLVGSFAAVVGVRKAMAEHVVADLMRHVPAPVQESTFARVSRLAARHPRQLAALGDTALAAFDVSEHLGPAHRTEAARQLEMAAISYRRIAAVTPLSAWAWWGLGEVYARQSGIDRQTETFALEGLTADREEDLSRRSRLALAAYRTAILLEPNSYEVHDDLALLYLQDGLRQAGLDAYRESGRIMPLYARHDYGPPESLEPDVYRAIASGMESALNEPSLILTAEVRQSLGDAAFVRGDFAEAARQYRLGVSAQGSRGVHGSLIYLLGETLRREGKSGEAVSWLQQATTYDVVAWRAWFAIGELRESAKDHCGSFEAFSAALAQAPPEEAVFAAVGAARAQAACGQAPAAIDRLRYLISSHPAALEARELLVRLLRENGRPSEALDEARALEAAAPGRTEYRDLRADVERKAAAGAVDAH